MKKRTKGFLAEDKIDHKSEIFSYIQELHRYLWRVIRCAGVGEWGTLDKHLDDAIEKLEKHPSVWAEGNSGGDYVKITKLNDNELQLEIACCCAVIVSHKIPVEFLTNLFYDLTLEAAPRTDQDGMIELAKKYIHYEIGKDVENVNEKRISKVKKVVPIGL